MASFLIPATHFRTTVQIPNNLPIDRNGSAATALLNREASADWDYVSAGGIPRDFGNYLGVKVECVILGKYSQTVYASSALTISFTIQYVDEDASFHTSDWKVELKGDDDQTPSDITACDFFANAAISSNEPNKADLLWESAVLTYLDGDYAGKTIAATPENPTRWYTTNGFFEYENTGSVTYFADEPTYVSCEASTIYEYAIEGDKVYSVATIKGINDSRNTASYVWIDSSPVLTDAESYPSDAVVIEGANARSLYFYPKIPSFQSERQSYYKNADSIKNANIGLHWIVPCSYYNGWYHTNRSRVLATVSYHPYDKPKLSATIVRCTDTGEIGEEGTCAAIDLTYIADALAGADSTDRPNPLTVKVTATSGDETHTQTFDLGNATGDSTTETLIFNAAELAASNAYSVSVTLTDSVGSTVTETSTISKSFFLMDFDGSTGKSIGIGQEAESTDVPDNGRLDISMDTYLHGATTAQAITADSLSVATLVGAIQMYGGSTAPKGWLLCDGSAVSRTEYAKLFAVLGTNYGAGDGSTTFNVPNFSGRFPIGHCNTTPITNTSSCDYQGGSSAYPRSGDTVGWFGLGEAGGEDSHVLTTAEMPSHNHSASTGSAGSHTHAPGGSAVRFYATTATSVDSFSGGSISGSGYKVPRIASQYSNLSRPETGSAGGHTHSVSVSNTGSSGAHKSMPPFLGVNYIIFAG